MRCDIPVYFQHITRGEYNVETGDYDPDTVTEVKRYASVSGTVLSAVQLVYGTLKQGSLTIRLLSPYRKAFDRIRIGHKIYQVDSSRILRHKQTFIVSEVQHGTT